MIQMGTKLKVSDNSGAKIVECLKIVGKKSNGVGSIGDIIVVSVKHLIFKQKSKIEKGGVYKALITETKKGVKRKDGSLIRFSDNYAVLLTAQGNLTGSRVIGRATYELRKRNQAKVLSLAAGVF